jgi:predicted HTH transcriptional regulator
MKKVIGLTPDEIEHLLERVPVSLADQIQPPIFPQMFEKHIDGKEVLVIQVFPANQRPCPAVIPKVQAIWQDPGTPQLNTRPPM